jgi:undecaprenyl-diphosphatase
VLLFLGAALESAAFLGFLVPGETIVILGGVLAHAGLLDLPETIVVVVSGAIIGDSIGYELGRRLGRPWLVRHGRLVGMHGGMLRRVDELFAQHGGKAVVLGRFVGFLRALAPFVAGASRMPYRTFLFYNALGALVWGPAFVLLGYFLGESWTVAERWIGRGGLVVGALLVAAAVLWIRHHRKRGTRTAPPA